MVGQQSPRPPSPPPPEEDDEDDIAEGMLPLASTSIPISKNGGASGMGGGGGDGGHGYGGGSGSGRQAPPFVEVEPKAIHHSRWAGGCNTEDIPLSRSQ